MWPDVGIKNSPIFPQVASVARWLDYLFNVWPLQKWEVAQFNFKFAKLNSQFCQIINEPFQNGQRLLTLCYSGEISPYLVALLVAQKADTIVLNEKV